MSLSATLKSVRVFHENFDFFKRRLIPDQAYQAHDVSIMTLTQSFCQGFHYIKK
jgi:hypothetical protein